MKGWIQTISLLMALATPCAFAQHQVSARFMYGAYLYNSENDIRVTKDEDVRALVGGNLAYGYRLSPLFSLSLSFTFLESNAQGVFSVPLSTGGSTPADMRLREYAVDIGVSYAITDWLEVRVGPSAAIINRSLLVESFVFEDQLSSKAIGFYGGGNAMIPIGSGFAAVGGIVFRYLHAISFDAAGRRLDGYSQTYSSATASVGMVYQF